MEDESPSLLDFPVLVISKPRHTSKCTRNKTAFMVCGTVGISQGSRDHRLGHQPDLLYGFILFIFISLQDPVIKTLFSNVYQHVCTYQDLYYRAFELPDCPPDVNPIVTYPVALSCNCGRCAMDTSDCTFESLQPDFCMNNIPSYY